MKRYAFLLLTLISFIPLAAFADGYTSLWQAYNMANDRDMPKSAITTLNLIIDKAKAEKSYGNLLDAQLLRIAKQSEIAPDSVKPMVAYIVAEEQKVEQTDKVLAAVYQSALGRIYANGNALSDDYAKISADYYAKSMTNPALLAKQQCGAYTPLVVVGDDSKIFNNDLLHVIGIEAGDFKTLYDYYKAQGNRPAECILSLRILQRKVNDNAEESKKSRHLRSVDSLLNVYKDLREAGEIAIEHYNIINAAQDVTPEEKYNYINYALANWGEWQGMNELRNAQKELTRPRYDISIGDEVAMLNKPRKVLVNTLVNISSITMRVYRADVSRMPKQHLNSTTDWEKMQHLLTIIPEATQTRNYVGQPEYKEITDSMSIVGLPIGMYVVEFTTSNKDINPSRKYLRVSDIYVVNQQIGKDTHRIAVVSATTGQPIPHANVRVTGARYYGKDKPYDATFTCDGSGELTFKKPTTNGYELYAYAKADTFALNKDLYGGYSVYSNNSVNAILSLYTDRSIYRPGQTVHVAGISYSADGKGGNHALAGQKVNFTLRDASYKEVATKSATTDDYGTVSADFVLPTGTLPGSFNITGGGAGSGSANFRVEEYKRPTFQVEFDKVSDAYKDGDTVTITGHATTFAGVPVQGAKVQYAISRRQAMWWYYRIANIYDYSFGRDSVTTAEDGSFKVRVPMILPQGAGDTYPVFFSFDVDANVTDIGGETQNAVTSLPLGTDPTAFAVNMPDKMERDSVYKVQFAYKNNAGQDIKGTVTYWLDETKYTCEANTPETISIAGMKSGLHHLVAVCGNDTIKSDFVIFSMDDKRPATTTKSWFYQSATTFPSDGKPVYIQVGSSDEGQHILYTFLSGDRVIGRGVIDQSNAINTRTFAYKDEYGEGITLSYAWVKDGVMYSYTANIARPLPDKHLNVTWATFRDRLTPGQKEEWTLKVAKPDGTPAKAQLLATMYDKSLDKFYPHSWSFYDAMYSNLPYTYWYGQRYNAVGFSGNMYIGSLSESGLDFSRFDYNAFEINMPVTRTYSNIRRSLTKPFAGMADGQVELAEVAVVAYDAPQAKTMVGSFDVKGNNDKGEILYARESMDTLPPALESAPAQQVRENLNETVFFYPALQADSSGVVSVKFTLPESVTTWRFMGLAHDLNMNNGMISGEAVASKIVMVQPNVPRFVRVGDNATVGTRIFNTSDKIVEGTATMQLLDPATEKVLYESSQPFSVKANGTGSATFGVDLTEKSRLANTLPPLVICRIMANGSGYSDGEQHYMPILPNTELVTVTAPFTQNKQGTLNIDVDKMFPVKQPTNKLTVEYTNNPAWLMVQALPSLSNTYRDDAISQAAAYYANSIAANILSESPQVENTISLWKTETGQETSLMSSLEKDQELKVIVLGETPWVADADKEGDQKQQLINFFDENLMTNRLSGNIQKLKGLQLADGSWTWWPGMPGNVYITMTVSEMLVRLNNMIGTQSDTEDMILNAFDFMDAYTLKEVADMKAYEKKHGSMKVTVGETVINYLYLRSLSDVALTPAMVEAKDYLLRRLDRTSTAYTIYGKAVMATTLAAFGYKQRAEEYLQSILEHTVYTEEKGRYFDTPKAYYSWLDYRIPTEVAAIEAIKAVHPTDTTAIGEMQRWLLQSKRTQGWDTPVNTVNAVYAFLSGGPTKILADNGAQTVLKVNGKELDLPAATAGLGYVKTAMTGSDMRSFTADKTSTGTSWGSLYAQFTRKSTDITASSSGISVQKEVIDMNGKKEIAVGDIVKVRLTITADRDYDFVQVVDKRAACMEPTEQLSGYRWGYYCAQYDNSTNYYFDVLPKGKHVIEASYFIDRQGEYKTGTCTAQCAYSPEYIGQAAGVTISVK